MKPETWFSTVFQPTGSFAGSSAFSTGASAPPSPESESSPQPASASAALGPATISGTGKAVAPKGAPKFVKQMIDAGNRIRRKPYDWGGGHGDFKDKGYDCSGAVSYVLHAAGLLDYPLVSGQLMKYGQGGTSRWVSIYASKTHVFMEIAGLRYDTSYITDGDKSGPGWSEVMRERKGFRVRHPIGT